MNKVENQKRVNSSRIFFKKKMYVTHSRMSIYEYIGTLSVMIWFGLRFYVTFFLCFISCIFFSFFKNINNDWRCDSVCFDDVIPIKLIENVRMKRKLYDRWCRRRYFEIISIKLLTSI